MDTRTILNDLKAELNHITKAIAALESLNGTATATTPASKAPQPSEETRSNSCWPEKIVGDDEGSVGGKAQGSSKARRESD